MITTRTIELFAGIILVMVFMFITTINMQPGTELSSVLIPVTYLLGYYIGTQEGLLTPPK